MGNTKLSVLEIYPPKIIREKNSEGYESCKLQYRVKKTGQKHFKQLDKLIPLNYLELEYFSLNGDLPDFSSCPTSVLMVPAFNFFSPLTFFWPIELRVGEIDLDAIESVDNFRKSVSVVYDVHLEKLSSGEISAGKKIPNKKVFGSKNKLVMYSGGVDSYSNIAHDYENMIVGSVEGLEATRGRDRNVTEPAMLVKRSEAARLADRFNTQAVVLKFLPYKYINQRLASDRIEELGIISVTHGFDIVSDTVLHIPLISMYAPYSYLMGADISIGSSYKPVNDYQRKHRLSGERSCANPEFSDALKFCGHRFTEQDGLYQMRTDKLADIVKFKKRTKTDVKFIVCFSETGDNCGKCKKCIRTQLSLLVLNEDPREWNFRGFSPSKLLREIETADYIVHDADAIFDIQHHINPKAKYKILNTFLHELGSRGRNDGHKRLVNIVTPCYNGGKYIHKLLDSVVGQTYPHVEMFVIDDGSTDNSAEIIKSYIPKFNKKGYKLKYVYQKNQGQSVAINNGIKLATGAYLTWSDADDYYADPMAILEMVTALDNSDDKTSMVRVQYNVLNENGGVINRLGVNDETKYKTDLFEDAVFGTNGFWYPPGGYMAKASKFDELIPGREIYTEKSAGQNFQLYLPLLYKQKCLTIEKYLYNIVAHDDSHSRNMATNNARQKIYYRTIKNTLDKIPLSTDYRKYLIKKVHGITIGNIPTSQHSRPYRTHMKRVVKGIVPYGLMMLYKRRNH